MYSDLVVPTVYGLNRLEQSPAGFEDTGTFVLTPNATAVVSDDFDLALDESADIVWLENAACAPGASTDSLCPITADAPGALGCLGLWLTEHGGPAAELKPPQTGACRRHPLSFQPSAICLADLDDDGLPDLVLSAPAERKVYVFAGDGNGGVLEPPQAFDAAGGADAVRRLGRRRARGGHRRGRGAARPVPLPIVLKPAADSVSSPAP